MLFCFALYAATLSPADELLCIQTPVTTADVLIVLGGDQKDRPARAAQLYVQGVAPRIIVTGRGDNDEVRQALKQAGVPDSVILSEPSSASTQENARFTSRLLRSRRVRRAVVVTSWFHTRRALASFEHYAPCVEFSAVPVGHDDAFWEDPTRSRLRMLTGEYLKTLWYALRYGISPEVKAQTSRGASCSGGPPSARQVETGFAHYRRLRREEFRLPALR